MTPNGDAADCVDDVEAGSGEKDVANDVDAVAAVAVELLIADAAGYDVAAANDESALVLTVVVVVPQQEAQLVVVDDGAAAAAVDCGGEMKETPNDANQFFRH